MPQLQRLLEHILMRRGDANVSFGALRSLLKQLGFQERIRGDHHIFTKDGGVEILNLQPKPGKAKPYRVAQIRNYHTALPVDARRRAMNSRYEMSIYWSAEDDAFVVEVPELTGCMADGPTYREAVANAQVIIDEGLETAAELGRPIPQPKGRLAYA